jgi:hypothetical protein
MEETHKHVRDNVKGAMHREKKYYDQKLSWQSFQPGDQVFVSIYYKSNQNTMVVCITGVCRQTFPTPLFIDLP